MDDLEPFLHRQFDADQQGALAAIGEAPDDGVWSTDGRVVEGANITIYDEGGHSQDQADYIARHDPFRGLLEVEAKRLQLVLHRGCDERCYVLRVLALPYARYPGYRPEWRP